MDVALPAAAPKPGTTGFTPERFTDAHARPARTSPAKYDLGDGHNIYIGSGVAFEGVSAGHLPWGVRVAGHDFDAAVAAARELSRVPFKPYGNFHEATTAVAVLQSKSGAYLLSTIWTTDFHSDTSNPVAVDELRDLATKRNDLVAIVDDSGWLKREGFTPTPR